MNRTIHAGNDVNPVLAEGMAAARTGNVKQLGAWLDRGNDPNQYDQAGWTPLLWASVRGRAKAVELLINNKPLPADVRMAHKESEALPIHLAGQSGSVETAVILLAKCPETLNIPWDLNGHTILLQAVFYGHLELAGMLLKRGARTDITTARGLGPLELVSQFQFQAMIDLIRPFDSSQASKAAYYKTYLEKIAPLVPSDQIAAQRLSDELVHTIENGIKRAFHANAAIEETLSAVYDLIEVRKADVNRLGGGLQQPPLIVTVTGNNGFPPVPGVVKLRNQLAACLLKKGADPSLPEKHPMGVQTVIRAAVFNHLEILRMCADYMSPQKLADAINEIPLVNGLTAMHDTVLRATMAAPDRFEGYLEQTCWFMAHGGRCDIEDFAGVTQRNIAERAQNQEFGRRLLEVMDEYSQLSKPPCPYGTQRDMKMI
ncbi:MAG: ankyrin repeat domain-containing protein [Candidatus Schekmanbacteria bacterium]|nr:ankyrin repeat domain-containing protein [Candidatus Schekmanbacteria bacterium]